LSSGLSSKKAEGGGNTTDRQRYDELLSSIVALPRMAPGKVPAKKSARAWDALKPPLAEWILDAVSTMGFAQMTPVQAATIPHFMGNKDVVVEVSLRPYIMAHFSCPLQL